MRYALRRISDGWYRARGIDFWFFTSDVKLAFCEPEHKISARYPSGAPDGHEIVEVKR